tara:strand:- start:660 stop:1082 length:423 start_codon:yes stop_codon:yes gene_type:complete
MNDQQIENLEFKVFGLNIETFSVFYGSFLIFWGLLVSFISGSNSLTSFIPSFIGLPILIFSNLSIKFTSKKKIFMHIVVLFGLIAFLGGLDFFRSILNGTVFQNIWADISKLILLTTGGYFVYQCIRSFIFARKNNNQLN